MALAGAVVMARRGQIEGSNKPAYAEDLPVCDCNRQDCQGAIMRSSCCGGQGFVLDWDPRRGVVTMLCARCRVPQGRPIVVASRPS
ncbi:MAG: hypothetical protein JO086_00080 [Acidimicrobiia bacterium]|nr:hypothetical protein [Acidimicrobiia bacterium]